MNLDTYLKQKSGNAIRLAAACGVSPAAITRARQSSRATADLALAIERATDGAVDAATLSATIAAARSPRAIASW